MVGATVAIVRGSVARSACATFHAYLSPQAGAAIAFLTGEQAKIPPFIDKLFLGWFFRILFSPKLYLVRYLKSIRLFFMIYKIKKISVKKI